MAIYIANDLHGNQALIQKVVNAIKSMNEQDTLVINGDGAGARGPIMNDLIRIFYEVRRGETDYDLLLSALTDIIGKKPEFPKSWVFDSVHGGVFRAIMSQHFDTFKQCVEKELFDVIGKTLFPLSDAAKEAGVRIIYVPGNGEIVPSDFATDNITVEKTLPPEKRFYQRIAKSGYFEQFGIEYVPYACVLTNQVNTLPHKVIALSTNLLDLPPTEALEMLEKHHLLEGKKPSKVIVHYPTTITIGKWFDFWTPNKVDISRIDTLQELLKKMQLKDATVFFGHIHLSANDQRMDALPPTIGFGYDRPDYDSLWIKPGEVIRIK